MMKLLKNKPLVVFVAGFILVVGGLIIAWLSTLYTLEHLSFRDVTPTQMAAAMRQDEFWSTYRFNTLVFDGKVQSISKYTGVTTLEFVTNDSYGASCQMGNTIGNFKVGETYKFETETYQAQRQPHGVLLHGCINQ
jgi:hypothetical protein